jgi:hypothetical protein
VDFQTKSHQGYLTIAQKKEQTKHLPHTNEESKIDPEQQKSLLYK